MSASQAVSAATPRSGSTFDEDAEFALRELRGPNHNMPRPSPATDLITMERAVHVPRALQSAARRTMLDVLTDIRTTRSTNAAPHAKLSTQDVPFVEHVTATSPKKDLRRSLRHLLPSNRRGPLDRAHAWPTVLAEESISDFGDEDDEDRHINNDNDADNKKSHANNVEAREKDSTTGGPPVDTTRDVPLAWTKLFDCEDDFEMYHRKDSHLTSSQPPRGGDHPLQMSLASQHQSCAKQPRISSRMLRAMWDPTAEETEVTDPPPRGTVASIVTLLDAAEAMDDNDNNNARVRLSRHSGGSSEASAARRRFMNVAAAAELEWEEGITTKKKSGHNPSEDDPEERDGICAAKEACTRKVAPRHSMGDSSAMMAMMTTIRGGRPTRRASTALRQLSVNPTAARVVAYLTRSFEDWRLDPEAIMGNSTHLNRNKRKPNGDKEALNHKEEIEEEIEEEGEEEEEVNEEMESEKREKDPLSLLESSGVQLKLLVTMIESAFSLYSVRGELVWADATTLSELGPTQILPNEKSHVEWSIVLATATFRSVPIVVGEHIYLARPFFCYPTLRAILASFNVASDITLRRVLQPALPRSIRHGSSKDNSDNKNMHDTHNRRRPRATSETHNENGGETAQEMEVPFISSTLEQVETHRAQSLEANTSAHALVEPSPFKAYDPFIQPPAQPFPRCSVGSLSTTPLRGESHVQRRSDSTPRKTMMSLEMGITEVCDAMGLHFPRGPGDEWDVPLEVLAAMRPSHKEGSAETTRGISQAGQDAFGGAAATWNSPLSSLESREGSAVEHLPRDSSNLHRFDEVFLSYE